eukprot:17501-Heterococcus_DN1.PRE.2
MMLSKLEAIRHYLRAISVPPAAHFSLYIHRAGVVPGGNQLLQLLIRDAGAALAPALCPCSLLLSDSAGRPVPTGDLPPRACSVHSFPHLVAAPADQ